jgi:outer membrane lipoprotein SlyB
MKGLLLVASGWLLVFASLGVSAQEMSVRKGVVTGLSPIQVQAERSSGRSGGSATGGAFGRILGRTVGRVVAKATGDYSDAYEAREIVDGASRDITTGAGNGDDGKTVAAYMVSIRFDDGNESAIQSARADNLRVGGRVKVFGSGSSTQIVAE